MIELLLTIIAAWGFLETAFWLVLFLAVVLILVLLVRAVIKGAEVVLEGVAETIYAAHESLSRRFVGWWRRGKPPRPPKSKIPPDINKARLAEWDDWIGKSRSRPEQERERKERDRRVEIMPPSKFETLSEQRPRIVLVSDWHSADEAAGDFERSLSERASDLLRTLRAINEGKSTAGRPPSPEMIAGIRRLLCENPDHRDYILDGLRRKGWRVDGP